MLLYINDTSSRLQYTISFIESIIGQQIVVTTDKELYFLEHSIKINYSPDKICDTEYHIIPHTLLFEKTIIPFEIIVTECRNNPCFFVSQDNHGFDVFAAIFYLISRYEEYLPHQKDMYGRYAHTNSLAYQHNFLNKPLVNYWIKDLVQQLTNGYQSPQSESHSSASELITYNLKLKTAFSFLPTYDIDIAFAYNHQSIIKNIGGFFKDLLKADIEKVIERATVYSGTKQDPFDTYQWLDTLHQEHHLAPIYFFLLANKKGIYDKNIPPTKKAMQQLLQQHAATYSVGIHPSWQSGDNKLLIKEEIESIKKITNKPCNISRQHYIRLTLPDTYRILIQNGITQDHSMGYGSINGFRASVASPFYWYDLEKERVTPLKLYPFCYMDANSFFEQHLSAEEAGEELQYYHDTVKAVGGQLITIFHNHFLTEQPQWKPWREMYLRFLERNF